MPSLVGSPVFPVIESTVRLGGNPPAPGRGPSRPVLSRCSSVSAGNEARDGRVVFNGVEERSRSWRDTWRDALFAISESVVDEMG